MHILKSLLLFVFVMTACIHADAQKKNNKPKPATTQKFKAPKLHSMLGQLQGTVSITAEDLTGIIGLPLKIYDDQKNEYSISSYQFVYNKLGVTEDENTGKTTPTTTMSADRFRSTPLPEVWIKTIKEQAKPGESFLFTDVIVKDTQGHVMYAADLKITIK